MSTLRFGVIGLGRVGWAMAKGLSKRGLQLAGVYSRSSSTVDAFNSKMGCSFENSLFNTVKESDMVFIAVPDSKVQEVGLDILAACPKDLICGKVFFHCSGALASDALDSLKKAGGYTGSFHPIQTFADRETGWEGLCRIAFGFEGCEEAKAAAKDIVTLVDGTLLIIDSQDKALYHAAACILSNYLVTLSHISGKILEETGIDPDTGIKAFLPLLQNTVRNIGELGSINALTGPVSRGDGNVVENHIRALNKRIPHLTEVYKMIGKHTVGIALEKGSISKDTGDRLYRLMEK